MCSEVLHGPCFGRWGRGQYSRADTAEPIGGRAAVAAGHAESGPPLQHHARCSGLPAAEPGLLEEAGAL